MIERAYTEGEESGLAVWTEDEAGPYQTVPYPGSGSELAADRRTEAKAPRICAPGNGQALEPVPSGHRRGAGARTQAHYQRGAPSLAQGRVHCDPRNLASTEGGAQRRAEPLRVEKLAGGAFGEDYLARRIAAFENTLGLGQPYRTPHNAELLLWMFSRGIMVLYTPLGGSSWLNMSESIQRILLVHRALAGEHPRKSPSRSWSGWRRRREGGIEIRRLLSGVAVGRHDESVLEGGGGTLWEEAALAHDGRSGSAGPSWGNGDMRVK